ncbi:MAG: AIR synthase-related protein, partial [Gallionellaceae bacterium]|nr:AIR synthase-related protein [Gallionellaceae bacterium]
LNKPGIALSEMAGVHALTDVTGFGLLGHTLELARGATLTAQLNMAHIPLLPNVQRLALSGCVTGASDRNWAGYGHDIVLAPAITPVQKILLTDPQTSGGLLVSCDDHTVPEVLDLFMRAGFAQAAVIGEMLRGPAQVKVNI